MNLDSKKPVIVGIAIFGVLLVIAMVFSFLGGNTELVAAELTVWGTVEEEQFAESISAYEQLLPNARIEYTEKEAATFETELLNALAAGTGPDLWITSPTMLREHTDKTLPIPPTLLTTNEFQNTFVDAATTMYLLPDDAGNNRIFALPLWSDPLVLYWNRALFNTAGIALPPTTWEQFLDFSQQLTTRDTNGNILVAGSAMGRATNIPRFREILSALFLQQGVDIVNADGSITFGTRERRGEALLNPTESVVRFYTDFTSPARGAYTWNPALPEPRRLFAEGRLAMMFDYGSVATDITNRDPHINFDIAKIPQLTGSAIPLTVSTLPAITVSKFTREPIAAWQFARWLTAPEQAATLIGQKIVAPATRGPLSSVSERPYWPVLQQSTLQASWLNDPQPSVTTPILREMITQITNGTKSIESAVRDAGIKIQGMLR